MKSQYFHLFLFDQVGSINLIKLSTIVLFVSLVIPISKGFARPEFSKKRETTTVLPDNAQLEERALKLENEIMAPCCFGGTLTQHAESPLTQEMKARIRLYLRQGMNDEKIIQTMVNFYGQKLNLPKNQWQRIRATPAAKGFNLLVWFLPFLALIGGAVLVTWIIRRFLKKEVSEKVSKEKNKDSSVDVAMKPRLNPDMNRRIEEELKNYRY